MSNSPQVNHQDIKAIFASHRRKLFLRVIIIAVIVILSAFLSFSVIKSLNQSDWIALIISTFFSAVILGSFQPLKIIKNLRIYNNIDLIEEKLKSDSRLATVVLSDDSLKEDPRFKYIQSQLVEIIKNDKEQSFDVDYRKTPFVIFAALLVGFVLINNYYNQNLIDEFNPNTSFKLTPEIKVLQQISQDQQMPSDIRSAIQSVINSVERSDYEQTGKLSAESIDAIEGAQSKIEQFENNLQENQKLSQQPTATPTATPTSTPKDSKSKTNDSKEGDSSKDQEQKQQQNKESSDSNQGQGDSKEDNKDKQSQSNSDQQQNSNQKNSEQNKSNKESNNGDQKQNDQKQQEQKGNQSDNKSQDNQSQNQNPSNAKESAKESESKQPNPDQNNQKQNEGQKSQPDSDSKPDQNQSGDKQGVSQKLSQAKKSLDQLKDKKKDKGEPKDNHKPDQKMDSKDQNESKSKDSKSGDKSGTGQSKNNDKQLSLTGESDKENENGFSPKKIEEKKLGNPDEKTDTRYTGNDSKISENKDPAKLKTELGQFDKLTQQEINESKVDKIPLEYKEYLSR